MKRAAGIVGAAWLGIVALAPADASSQIGPNPNPPVTEVTYTGSPTIGAQLTVTAAAGVANQIGISDEGTPGGLVYFSIRDPAGVTVNATPHCDLASATEVRCDTNGFTGPLTVSTGDRDDVVRIRNRGVGDPPTLAAPGERIATTASSHREAFTFLSTGPGKDEASVLGATGTLIGEGASDTLSFTSNKGSTKPAVLRGGAEDDRLRGGRGPQRLFGETGNDWFSCGTGRDFVNGGPGDDRGGRGCERFASTDEEDFPPNS